MVQGCSSAGKAILLAPPRNERCSEVTKMSSQKNEELVSKLAELIRTSAKVCAAVWECACSCPNLLVQY